MPTFEAITLTFMFATVTERISEAIVDLVNAHLAKPKGLKPVAAVNSLLEVDWA